MTRRVKPDDVVAAVYAFRSQAEHGGIDRWYLHERVANAYDKGHRNVLEEAGIRPHPIHRDSLVLQEGIDHMMIRGVLGSEVPGNTLRWRFVLSPQRYFDTIVRPELTPKQVEALQELAQAL